MSTVIIPSPLRSAVSDGSGGSDGSRGGNSEEPGGERRVSEHVVELDEVFRALGDARRRRAVSALAERSEWSLRDLARWVAAREADVPEGAVEEADERRVYSSLYHVHVPLLVELDVVTFDAETERVRAAERTDRTIDALAAVGTALDSASDDPERDGES